MTTRTYWVANKETADFIRKELDEWGRIIQMANLWAKRLGASRIYTSYAFSRPYVSGVVFKKGHSVDPKLFVRLKGTADGYRPRHSTKLGREMEQFFTYALSNIMERIKMDSIHASDQGPLVRRPGIEIIGDQVALCVPADVKPAGCRRISDMAYEKMSRKPTGAAKSKRKVT